MSRIDSTERFVIEGWKLAGETLCCHYRLGPHRFVERVELAVSPARLDPEVLSGLADLLCLVAGVSYYKAAAPPLIEVESLAVTPAGRELVAGLYGPGLGEFRHLNGLDPAVTPELLAPERDPEPDGGRSRSGGRVMVPVGGGKDSIVTIELMRRTGRATTLFTVFDYVPMARTAAVAGLTRMTARRSVDRRLIELNEAGALNGHVPITAITSMVALLSAAGVGAEAVVMSNEHSASAPTRVTPAGVEVNHQYSKGVAFEGIMRQALAERVPGAPDWFSVLRPWMELTILREFSRHREYFGVFVSCNANYGVFGDRQASSWCGRCPKCRFIFLGLAAFCEPADLVEIFGRDLLADPGQTPGFAELFGIGGPRPFECTGTVTETAVALDLVADQPGWRRHPVVRELIELTAGVSRDDFAWTHLDDTHFVPDDLADLLDVG